MEEDEEKIIEKMTEEGMMKDTDGRWATKEKEEEKGETDKEEDWGKRWRELRKVKDSLGTRMELVKMAAV